MANSIPVTFAVLLVISCLYSSWGFPASQTSSANNVAQQSQGAGAALPKKVHLVNPGGNRLYRVFRFGTNSGSDDEDLFLDEDSVVQKRGYDDYGHMRFGKRQNRGGDFDDYGHLRFGK